MQMLTSRRASDTGGMTLVELMIVVVIIGILAAIAVVGYRKYVGRARLSEASAMLAEFAGKEQLFYLDNGQYLAAHANGGASPYDSENAADFWPQNPTVDWDSARNPVAVYDANGKLPDSWRSLGIRPRWRQLFCTYLVNAGAAGIAAKGYVGPTVWGAAPNVPWFYALGVCNLVGAAGWSGDLGSETIMILSHDSPALRTLEEVR